MTASDQDMDMKDKKPDSQWNENEAVSRVGSSVFASIPTFSDSKNQQARRFIEDFEEALDLSNITLDKYKRFHFKTKLRGLPYEWYETVREEDRNMAWNVIKTSFLQQFDKTQLRPKDVLMRLMNIRQNVGEDEPIQSLSIRITKLFIQYNQTMGKMLTEQEKIEYFIESLFPSYKEQLNNQYQSVDGVSYDGCTFEEVSATALKLERNARAYEEDVQQLPGAVGQLRINSVHKAANPTSQVVGKEELKFKKAGGRAAPVTEEQNAEDIKKMQKEQLIIKDQLTSVSNALQNFGEQMRSMRGSIENLRYERKDCPGT
jgi:hypothetical protein